MTDLIAIDVGGHVKGCSAALFRGGELVQALPRIVHATPVDRVVVERPQQDGRSRAVPPAQLIDLAWTGAVLYGGFLALGAEGREYTPTEWKGTTAKAVHHWRLLSALTEKERWALAESFGNKSEAGLIAEVQAARTAGALKRWAPHKNGHYAEKSRTPDVLDAVGLGLFDLGRITKEGYSR